MIQQTNNKTIKIFHKNNETLCKKNVILTCFLIKNFFEIIFKTIFLHFILQYQEIQFVRYICFNFIFVAEFRPLFLFLFTQYNFCIVFVILLTSRHNELTILITRQIDEFDEANNETLKRYAAEIQKTN